MPEASWLLTCEYCGIDRGYVCGDEGTRNHCNKWRETVRRFGSSLEDRQRAASQESRSSFAPEDGWERGEHCGRTRGVNGAGSWLHLITFPDDTYVALDDTQMSVAQRGQVVSLAGWHYRAKDKHVHRKRAETFAPDERPHEYRRNTDGSYRVVSVDAPPFTPEQDKRLRQIAWEAAEAFAMYAKLSRDGVALQATHIRDAFLRGDA
jgi:hypothetical protein